MTRLHRRRRRLIAKTLKMPTPLFVLEPEEIRLDLESGQR